MKTLAPLLALAALLLVGLWLGTRLLGPDRASVAGTSQDSDSPDDINVEPNLAASGVELDLAAQRPDAQARTEAALEPTLAPIDAHTGTLLVRSRTKDDQEVPNVCFAFDPRDENRLGSGVQLLMTDANGRAVIEGLAPGKVLVRSLRGPSASGEIVAGEELELVLDFEGTVDVIGIVVDADGGPVADADVWIICGRRDWLTSQRITRTAADGTFAVPFVDEDRSLGASAPGFGPSKLGDLSLCDRSKSPVQIELTLAPDGGGLRGLVLSALGRPVGGARVAVGKPPKEYSVRMDGSIEEFWGALVAVTDADGAYELRSLAAGVHPIAVSTHDYVELASEVEIVVGEVSVLNLTLVSGLRVAGIVRDVNGDAIEHALIIVLEEPFQDPFPTQGPTDRGAPFHRPAARSAADGSFALEHLAPGDVHLYAAKGTSFWDGRKDEFLGTCQATLTGAEGDVLEWDPVLERGSQIRGRVTYLDGRPLGNVFVSVFPADDKTLRLTEHADADGRFVVPGLENRPYTVHVQLWDAPDDAPPLERPETWPSDSEVVIVASFSKSTEPLASVTVRVSDDAHRLQGKGMVVFADESGWAHASEEDGVFSRKLKPGRYQTRVMSGDAIVGYGDWFEVGPGEERDLGTVHTLPGGGLTVRVERVPGTEESRLWVSVGNDKIKQPGQEIPVGESEVTFDNLIAGTIRVQIGGAGIARVRREVVIDPDRTVELDVRLQLATQCVLIFEGEPVAGWVRLDIVVRDAQGAVYHEWTRKERWDGALPVETKVAVPCGRYTLEATTSDGRRVKGEFTLDSLDSAVTTRLALE